MKEIEKYNDQHVRQQLYEGGEDQGGESINKPAFFTPQKGNFTGIVLADSPVKSLKNNQPTSEKKASDINNHILFDKI